MQNLRIAIVFIFVLTCNSLQAIPLLGEHYKIVVKDNIDYSEEEMGSYFEIIDSFSAGVYYIPTLRNELASLKNDSIYKSTIESIVNSPNKYKRAVAHRLIALVEDTSFNNTLIQMLSTYYSEYDFWTFASFCVLSPTSTNVAIDWLIKHEDFSDAHAIPFYLQMDTVRLLKTSYQYLTNKDDRAKVISLQTISLLEKSDKTDSLCRDAIINWNINIKGYAIAALGECKKGNYKDLLSPYINKENLNFTIKYVLESSPTNEDNEFAKTITVKK